MLRPGKAAWLCCLLAAGCVDRAIPAASAPSAPPQAVPREWQTSKKVGCEATGPCWYEYVRWRVVDGVPTEVNRRSVQRVPGEREGEWVMVEREERFEDGHWVLLPRRLVEESKPEAVEPAATDAGPTLVIEPPELPYRFELRFQQVFDADAAYFECDSGPLLLTVTHRQDASFSQELPLEQICVVRDAQGNPLVNGATLYDDQGMIQVGDFDFDGALDFAVQDGKASCYGGPSYHVFLFDASSGRFVPNEAFTALAQEWCGFFSVDAKKQELLTSTKSGCCWHEFARWKVVSGAPQQVYRLTLEHKAGAREGELTVVESEERLVRGRWIERRVERVEKE